MSDHFALRYMRRFSCVGPACPATCCSGWSISVDEASYRSLRQAMSGTKPERERFADNHTKVDAPEPRRHAALRMLESGDCAFLGADKLCTTHATYGEKHLSDTCASYPRHLSMMGDRVELSGALSCPEAARLALLDEDALELDGFDPTTLTRPVVARAFGSFDQPVTAYGRYLDVVRGTITMLLSVDTLPLAARLFLVARFADRTQRILHVGLTEVDEAALGAELAAATDPLEVAKWGASFAQLAPSGPRAGVVLLEVLKARLDEASNAPFRALVTKVLGSYGAAINDELALDAAAVLPAYFSRRARWQTQHGARIDAMMARYCKQFWMTSWYTESPNLLAHAQKLHLRVALIRFLLLSHPDLGAATDEGARDRLDRLAVEVTHTFSRAIEHHGAFKAQLDELLARLEVQTLAQSIYLLAL